MLTYIIIGVIILVLVLSIKTIISPSLNTRSNGYVPTSGLIRQTEERNETTIENLGSNSELEDYEEYEIAGVHIPNRKNYILNYCSEYDELELEHEKNNKYSSRAIVVKHDGKKIGYIAECDVEEVHEIITKPFTSHIAEIEYDGSYLTLRAALEC